MSHICLSHLSVKSWGGYSPARPKAIALRAARSAAPPHPKKESKMPENTELEITATTDAIDVGAEINSLKEELQKLQAEKEALEKDLMKTKTVNFTMARRLSAEPIKAPEEIIHNMMQRG